MHLITPCTDYRTPPLPLLEVVVGPIDATRSVGLAHARLSGVVAPVVPNLAHQPTQPAVGFELHFKPGFEQQVQAAYAISGKSQAILLDATICELQYDARVALLALALTLTLALGNRRARTCSPGPAESESCKQYK